MDVKTILENYHKDEIISEDLVNSIQNNNELRKDLVFHFRRNKDKGFALKLLETFITIRQQPNGNITAEDLMLSCYILGLHNQIEDCLKIWEAKNTDFDTYCGLDIQLVPFAGVDQTIEFLKGQSTPEGKKAFNYISECSKCGDFDNLEEYYSNDHLPWFV